MSANQQSALSSLRAVAPIAARLEGSRDGEDRAADILELWQGTETALRALMGGASLGGQALIRELRQQELISLGQAYSLLEFLGARDRANRASYRPSDNDVAVAREGYHQLEAGLSAGLGAAEAPPLPPRAGDAAAAAAAAAAGAGATSPYAPGASSYAATSSPYAPGASRAAPGPVTPPATYSTPIEPAPGYATAGRRIPSNLWFIIALAVIVLGAIGGYAMFVRGRGNPAKDMVQAATMMQTGQREASRTEFSRIARENPNLAEPHVFLARLAREDGDIQGARRELDTAIRLEPKNAKALREMGLILFSTGDYELARRFFVRAVQIDPADNPSQGYLGCALARLNRIEEAQRFLTRAGPGAWSSCTQRPL